MRLAIFGGTFDPIHKAHLAVARRAADRFQLDRVLFVPASHPPHKAGITHAPYDHRVRMAELACQGEARFEVSRLEEGGRRSYSIDTIEKLQARIGPADELFFIIGADAFAEIRTWRRWEDVARRVRFIVVSRPGHLYEDAAGGAPGTAGYHRATGLFLGNPPRPGGGRAPRRSPRTGFGVHPQPRSVRRASARLT